MYIGIGIIIEGIIAIIAFFVAILVMFWWSNRQRNVIYPTSIP